MTSAAAGLREHGEDRGDGAALSQARTNVNLARCALQVIDLRGAAHVLKAIETLLHRWESADRGSQPNAIDAVCGALATTLAYLELLAAGQDVPPMRLYAKFRDILVLLNAQRVTAADLLFPDISRQPPFDAVAPLTPESLRQCRTQFEQSLLGFLRQAEDRSMRTAMSAALSELENLPQDGRIRSFWWVVHGLLDGLAVDLVPVDLEFKRFLTRLNSQLRRLIGGNAAVAERLMIDALFYIGRTSSRAGRLGTIKQLYDLDRLVPADLESQPPLREPAPRSAEVIAAIAQAQRRWDPANGALREVDEFAHAVTDAQARAASAGLRSLADLLGAVAHAGRQWRSDAADNRASDRIAEALLVAELNEQRGRNPDPAFDRIAAQLAARLIAASDGVAVADDDGDLIAWIDRMNVAQSLQAALSEIRKLLHEIELRLDRFFRSPDARGELAQLPGWLAQAASALELIDLPMPAAALRDAVNAVDRWAKGEQGAQDSTAAALECERIAANLSATAFLMEALGRDFAHPFGRFEWCAEDGHFRADLTAAASASPGLDVRPAAAVPTDASNDVEASIRAQIEYAEALAWRITAGEHSVLPDFDQVLKQLQSDAELIDDDALKERIARAAVLSKQLSSQLSSQLGSQPGDQISSPLSKSADAGTAAELLGLFTPDAIPAAPAPPTLTEHDAGAVMQRSFMEETEQIFGRIDAAVASLVEEPGHRDPLKALRQSCHNLKESSRMIGQEPFGEAAAAIEHCLDTWLAEERPVSNDLIQLICSAREQMAQWIGELRGNAEAVIDSAALAAAADGVCRGERLTLPEARPAAAPRQIGDNDLPEFEFEATGPQKTLDAENVKRIGPVIVGRQTFARFLNDADDYIRTLARDLSEWRFEERPASALAVGVAGQLARALDHIGLAPVAALALPLEQLLRVLSADADLSARLDAMQFDQIDSTVARMRGMLHQFAADIYPSVAPADVNSIKALLARVQAHAQTHAGAPADSLSSAAAVIAQQSAVDLDLQRVFLEEGADLLSAIGTRLRLLVAEPENQDIVPQLLRLLHTAKGSARVAGAMQLGEILHLMEARLQITNDGSESSTREADTLQTSFDEAVTLFEHFRAQVDPPRGTQDPNPVTAAPPSTLTSGESTRFAFEQPTALASVIRVRADLLDNLVDHVGEFSIARAKMDNQIGMVRGALDEFSENLQRLRSQMRELEVQADAQIEAHTNQVSREQTAFDPLEHDRYTRLQELTRMLRETVEDISMLQAGMTRHMQTAEADLAAQGRLTREIQQEVMRVRLVTFAQIAERLHRVVRQTAREAGKEARLALSGDGTEIDRGVLEKMAGPLEHLLRNAVVHGIETPEGRRAAGKPTIGEIGIDVRQRASEIVITVSDDGAGLNIEGVRSRAMAAGIFSAEHKFADHDAIDLIFMPGFTTAPDVTELAGRGVGIDVVRNELASFGGRMTVDTKRGHGMRFTLHLPPTLAVMQALLAQVGTRRYAIPAGIVEQIIRCAPLELGPSLNQGVISVPGFGVVELRSLAQLIGVELALPHARQTPIAILKSGNDRLAIAIDDISIQQEIIVKGIGGAARLNGMLGATIIGGGEIALIIDPVQLITRATEPAQLTDPHFIPNHESDVARAHAEDREERPARVMVVDDSLTVRRFTQRLLERHGFIAAEAHNGIDALQRIATDPPALMLIDIEMPHMDGFELLRRLRADPATRTLPVIMVTSRIGDKHRRLAVELGADEYIGKPYQEEELIGLIRRLLATARPH